MAMTVYFSNNTKHRFCDMLRGVCGRGTSMRSVKVTSHDAFRSVGQM